jgi:hypothetical protein
MGFKHKGVFFLAAVMLAAFFVVGCATQTHILHLNTYVGSDVRDVIRDYGPPVHAHDAGRGTRVFQWEMNGSFTFPKANEGELETVWLGRKRIGSRGKAKTSCLYTLHTEWNKRRGAWIVVNHIKPRRACYPNSNKPLPSSTYAGVSGSY